MIKNKFRVWDKKRREMSYAPNYQLSADGLLHWQFGYESNLLDQENFEVMFYMGKIGDNEIDIYEGDIIVDSFFRWEDGKTVEDTPGFWHEYIEYGIFSATIKIIGNIKEIT